MAFSDDTWIVAPEGGGFHYRVGGAFRDPVQVSVRDIYVVSTRRRAYVGIASNGEIFPLEKRFRLTKADLNGWRPRAVQPLPPEPRAAEDTRALKNYGRLVIVDGNKRYEADGAITMQLDRHAHLEEVVGQARSIEAAEAYIREHAARARAHAQRVQYGLSYAELAALGVPTQYGRPHCSFGAANGRYEGPVVAAGIDTVIQRTSEGFVGHLVRAFDEPLALSPGQVATIEYTGYRARLISTETVPDPAPSPSGDAWAQMALFPA
jgi:hypothetical protein